MDVLQVGKPVVDYEEACVADVGLVVVEELVQGGFGGEDVLYICGDIDHPNDALKLH